MPLYIEATKDGQPTSLETWDDILFESAKEHARTLVENDLADRVEIRDENKQLLYHYPRTLQPAPNT